MLIKHVHMQDTEQLDNLLPGFFQLSRPASSGPGAAYTVVDF